MKRYPAIEFAARHGRRIAVVGALLFALGSVVCVLRGGPVLALAIGLPAALALFALLRLGAEMIEVIADTLLPR